MEFSLLNAETVNGMGFLFANLRFRINILYSRSSVSIIELLPMTIIVFPLRHYLSILKVIVINLDLSVD
jgi:hypothetical protein